MATKTSGNSAGKDSAASLGIEAKLWLADDVLRSNMDTTDYDHVLFRQIFKPPWN